MTVSTTRADPVRLQRPGPELIRPKQSDDKRQAFLPWLQGRAQRRLDSAAQGQPRTKGPDQGGHARLDVTRYATWCMDGEG